MLVKKQLSMSRKSRASENNCENQLPYTIDNQYLMKYGNYAVPNPKFLSFNLKGGRTIFVLMKLIRLLPARDSVTASSLQSRSAAGYSRFGIAKVVRCALTTSAFAALIPLSHAELVPAARLVDWTPGVSVGVPGGIPTRTKLIDVTKAPYGADKTGASDTSAAIQAAVNAAGAQDVVYLPAGTYRVNVTIYVNSSKDNITIRGDGNSTIIDARTGTVFAVGASTDYAWANQNYAYPSSGNTVTAGMSKGSTSLTIADTSAFSAGQMIQVALQDQTNNAAIMAGAVPVVGVGGGGTLRRQMSRVTSKTATTLKIFPALHFTADAGLVAKVNVLRAQVNGFGLESLYINCANSAVQSPIAFNQCYGSWVKEVKVYRSKNYSITIDSSLNCEIRKCYLSEKEIVGSNGAGLLMNHVGNSLIEDNIIHDIFPCVEINASSTGNVVAYNFLNNLVGGNLNVNHGPHNSFNLYEGNVTPNIQSDGYFGGSSDDTFYRNWITGAIAGSNTYTSIIGLNRFARNYSFVGNILGSSGWPYGPTGYSFGNPNMGNSLFLGSAEPSAGLFWRDWKTTGTLSTRASDNTGTLSASGGSLYTDAGLSYPQLLTLRDANTGEIVTQVQAFLKTGSIISFQSASISLPSPGATFELYWGSSGFQELDLDVKNTTVLKANYQAWSAGGLAIPAAESIGSDSLPNSLYRATKPDWFGDRPWPAFDPFNPVPSYDNIPAGYRYLHDSNPLPGIAAAPSNVKIRRQ